MEQVTVTTEDNPYCPFTQFQDWYAFDTQKGYNTASYLARVIRTSDELSYSNQAIANERAVNSIVTLNLTGNYIKVRKTDEEIKKVLDKQKVKSKMLQSNVRHMD